MTPEELKQILDKHALWLKDDSKGVRAHLEWANLEGAILDFSCFPLWCGSFTAKADDRLVLQLFAHIARLDVEACSEEVKELVLKLPELAKNGFCKYQNAVKEVKP